MPTTEEGGRLEIVKLWTRSPHLDRVRAAAKVRPRLTKDSGMMCPTCGRRGTAVLDSRLRNDNVVRRTRCCVHCGFRFTTYEQRLATTPAPDFQI